MPELPGVLDRLPGGAYKYPFSSRWGFTEVFDNGYVPVPNLFLQTYASLKPYPLTPGEAMFVLELMTYKWREEPPFPAYQRIADRMNVTDKMVRRYAQSLEAKGYLRRGLRKNQTNEFDLSGLFRALYAVALLNDHASHNLRPTEETDGKKVK
jgi:hypothetical protein